MREFSLQGPEVEIFRHPEAWGAMEGGLSAPVQLRCVAFRRPSQYTGGKAGARRDEVAGRTRLGNGQESYAPVGARGVVVPESEIPLFQGGK